MNKNTLFVGQFFLEYPTLHSTNVFATDYLSKNNPSEGTVIATTKQTGGKGQIGSKWESEADKNISLSIILYPKFLAIAAQFELSKAVSLAVLDLVQAYCPAETVAIKWPNDVYVRHKKIAGILIQNTISSHAIKSAIVGIGININQEIFVSNPPNPTSLKLETGREYDLKTLSLELCWHIEKWYLKLKAGKKEEINTTYLAALYQYGVERAFRIMETGETIQGKITGIASSGQLQIKTEQGVFSFGLKEVQFI